MTTTGQPLYILPRLELVHRGDGEVMHTVIDAPTALLTDAVSAMTMAYIEVGDWDAVTQLVQMHCTIDALLHRITPQALDLMREHFHTACMRSWVENEVIPF
jgi:hypothetical protein